MPKKMIIVKIRGGKLSLCQVRNRSVQTGGGGGGGSMAYRNLLSTSFAHLGETITERKEGKTVIAEKVIFRTDGMIMSHRAKYMKFNPIHTGGVFHLQTSKLLRAPKQNKPSP